MENGNGHQSYHHRGMWYYVRNGTRVYFDSRTQVLLEEEYVNQTQNLTFYDVDGGVTSTINLVRMEMERNEITTYRVVREDPMNLIVPIQYDEPDVQDEMTEAGAVGVSSEDLPELELTESDATESDELTESER